MRNVYKIKLNFWVLFVFSGLSISGCIFQSKHKEIKKTHIIVQAGRMGHKPWEKRSSYNTKVTLYRAIFTNLLYFNKNYEIEPGIFKDWSWDSKNNAYVFEVVEGLEFSSDRKLQLKDIEFAIVKNFLAESEESNHYMLSNILGSEKLKKGQEFKTGICEGVRLELPNKIIIKLKKPNHLFMYALGDLMPPIAPVEDFKKDLFSFKNTPRGTGPYKIVFDDPSSSLVKLMKKNASNKSKAPYTVDLFSHGTAIKNNVDLAIGAGGTTLKGHPDFVRHIGSVPIAINLLDFNYLNKYAKQRKFRQAISLALDRDKLTVSDPTFKPAQELVPALFYGHSGKRYELNPSRSRSIVGSLFKNISAPNRRLKGLFHGPLGLKKKKRYVLELERQLEDVGLYFDLKPVERIDFKSKETKDVVFVVYGLVTSFVDPATPFMNYLDGGTMGHNHDVNDVKIKQHYVRILNSMDKTERAENIKRMSIYFQSNFVTLPLQEIYPSFMTNKKIKNIGLDHVFHSVDLGKVEVSGQ